MNELVKEMNLKVFTKIKENLIKNIEKKKAFVPETPTIKTPDLIKPITHDTEEDKIHNTHVLNTAGIEIIPEKLELKKGEEVHPILAQKLNSTFQTPTVTTEHSLENLTKMSNQNDTISQPPKPAPSAYPPKGDPYRLSPD